MLSEKKIGKLIEDELLWLEKFAATQRTNIYKNNILEADRRIVRMSTLYEVTEDVPSDDAQNIVRIIKDKLQEMK